MERDEPSVAVHAKIPTRVLKPVESRGPAQRHKKKWPDPGWAFLVASAAILIAVLWWNWNRGWEELESGLAGVGAPKVQAHVPADTMEKLVTHRVDPEYPPAARSAHLQGVVVLDVVVGTDGTVADVHALDGPEILTEAATNAMRWWRFNPYLVDGKPVVAETTVAVEFKP